MGEWGKSHGSPCGMADDHRRKGSLQGSDSAQNARAPAARGKPPWEGESLEQGVINQSRGGGHLHGREHGGY